MAKKLYLISLLFLSICCFAGSERLVGTWKSNKQETLAYLKNHTRLTSQQLDMVAQSLGKTTLTFDKTNVTMSSGSWKFISPYKIVSETTNVIIIESKDPNTQKMARGRFEFDGNGFWIPDDKILGYKERFDRLKQK